MFTRSILFLYLLIGGISCWSQTESSIQMTALPAEVVQELAIPTTDPEIKDLQWNRWTSKNFVVCSIDNKQAEYLIANLENIKKWIYERWGFKDQTFVAECRLICVNDPRLFGKFFNLEKSRAEIRYDSENKPDLMVIFYLLDGKPSSTVPGPLTEICLANIDEIYKIDSPVWVVQGMRVLNGTLPSIKLRFGDITGRLTSDKPMYFSQGLTSINPNQYKELSDKDKELYDTNAMAFCLMLRKEFGQNSFHHFYFHCANGKSPEEGLKKYYNFNSYDNFDQSFKKFLIDTTNGLQDGSVRDNYLQINKAR